MKALTAILPIGLLALLQPVPARAQAYQCRLPDRVGTIRPVTPDGPARQVAIAGYTLNASWSPEYCKTSNDSVSMQCSGRQGRFGFVLHGVWPEGKAGLWPQWCGGGPEPNMQDLRPYLCMTPSAQLLAHEWAKHGSCMARTPETYFKVSARLWRALRWPDADRLSRQEGLTAGDLRAAFVLENPDWRTDQVGLLTSRNGWLKEVRLCYSRRFMPTRCTSAQYGPSDVTPLKIWRGL